MDIDSVPDQPMVIRDATAGGLSRVNRKFTDLLGYSAEELTEKPLLEWIVDEDRATLEEALKSGTGTVRARHKVRVGEALAFKWQIRTEEGGPVAFGLHQKENVEIRKPVNAAPRSRDDLMTLMLDAMVLVIEEERPGMKCSVILLDKTSSRVHIGAGPSLGPEFNQTIEGLMIGPGVLSCGTAAYWNERIIVEDIQFDPLWAGMRGVAVQAGVQACWSHPITSHKGEVMGATALYNPTPRTPTQSELDGLAKIADMFGVAIEGGLSLQELRESEMKAQHQSHLLRSVTEVITSFIDTGDWREAGIQLVHESIKLTGSEYGFLGELHDGTLHVLAHEGMVWSKTEEREFYDQVIGDVKRDGYEVFDRLDNLFGAVITTGKPVLSNNAPTDNRAGRLPAGHPELRSFLGAPIQKSGSVVAMIGVANAKTYTDADVTTLEHLCQAASVVFDSHARTEHEIALENQLQHAAQQEALGVLAGGVAHDFNNILMAILGNTELARMELSPSSPVHSRLDLITTSSKRAADLCQQMLTYSGKGKFVEENISLSHLVEEMFHLLEVSISKNVVLKSYFADSIPTIKADPTQISQIVMNLITNASEAIGEKSGAISINVGAMKCDQRYLAGTYLSDNLAESVYVYVEIEDTGCGMEDEIKEKLFEPFFTTKFTGRGLGLSAVLGIVRGHKGTIKLQSEPGVGTTIRVLFPALEQPVPSMMEQNKEIGLWQGSGTILLVDDEESVLAVTGQLLQKKGFEVLTARDGRECIDIFKDYKDEVICVLLDLTMPHMDGEATYSELRRIKDDVKVILCSGYNHQDIATRFVGKGLIDFLQKPYGADDLFGKLHEVLDMNLSPDYPIRS